MLIIINQQLVLIKKQKILQMLLRFIPVSSIYCNCYFIFIILIQMTHLIKYLMIIKDYFENILFLKYIFNIK